MAGVRDSQRSKVYAAELAVAWSDKAKADLTVGEAQTEATRAVLWLRTQGFDVTAYPTVEPKRGRTSTAWRSGGRIAFASAYPKRWVLLHEVAHLAQPNLPAFDGAHDTRPHGAEFLTVYLRLVRHFLGVTDHDALRAEFKARKVRYTPKRTRVISDEQRAELTARLASARPKVTHRYALVRTHPKVDGPIYLARATGDRVRYRHDNGWWAHVEGTCDPARALTRTTDEGIRRAAREHWAALDVFTITDIIDQV